jgi:hypothetical protein
MRKKEVSREVEIMCDYARPEMIEDLDNAGFYVLKADKSVDAGINFLNQMKVYVHADSINIQRENRLYKRKVMNGIISEQIDKKNDDAMDAARYAAMEIKSAFYGGSAYESF